MKDFKTEKKNAKTVVKDVLGKKKGCEWFEKIEAASSVIQIDNIIKSFWETVL